MANYARPLNIIDGSTSNRMQGQSSQYLPRANLLAAAQHIRDLFDGKKFNWAAMCGLAMLCLGSRREVSSLHIVYDDRDFQRIKMKLEADKRLKLPQGMNPLFPAKVFIGTGPNFNDTGCARNIDVELWLIPPGTYGTPPNDILKRNEVQLRLDIGGKTSHFRGLNMLYLIKTTLQYCKDQNVDWDPKMDILFLCQNYHRDIEAIQYRLDPKELHAAFFSTILFSRLPPEFQRKCSKVLIGREVLKSPPPSMALTPPPSDNENAQAFSEISSAIRSIRPVLQSHKSTPQLRSNAHQLSAFLSPLLPSKFKPSEQITGLASAPPTLPSPSSRQDTSNEVIPTGRDSRSRYRPISAPNMPGHTRHRSTSPQMTLNSSDHSRSKSMDPNVPNQQPVGSTPVQTHANVAKTQVVPYHLTHPLSSAPKVYSVQVSMPNLKTASSAKPTIPVFAHALPPVGVSFTSSLQHQQSPQPNTVPTAKHGQSIPPQHAYHGRHFRDLEVSTSPMTTLHTRTTLGQSEGDSEINTQQRRSLRVVGPDGIHVAPLKKPQQEGVASAASQEPSLGRVANNCLVDPAMPKNHMFAVELPATAPTPTPPVNSQVPSPDSSPKTLPQILSTPLGCQALQQPRRSQPVETLRERSDVVFELPEHPTPSPLHQTPAPPRPANPRAHTEPIAGLPPSLMAGGPAGHHFPKNSLSHSTPQRPAESAHVTTNADRYNRYYVDHTSSNPNSPPQPTAAPVSEYRAYHGPTSPPISVHNGYSDPKLSPPNSYFQVVAPQAQEPPARSSHLGLPPSLLPVTHNADQPSSYRSSDDVRYAPLQPVGAVTGYEKFAHGPYTPTSLNNSPASGGDEQSHFGSGWAREGEAYSSAQQMQKPHQGRQDSAYVEYAAGRAEGRR